ncbi:hypothetical protein E8E13_008399 [Curvularia kusanoi]|uniref:Uncharacterized protein n=1 Tax=Curvularia kusanoi TaxID=90978 RepID=A0A9P4WEA7_CURKU|nr:hypothetical protein E8E13_008399 [Curvularia kusanoi]
MTTAAPSFIDDGTSFPHRHSLFHTHPAPPASSTSSSPSTSSSYVDPGSPLPPPSPHSKCRAQSEDTPWNDDIARAVSGDIGRSLARLRRVASVRPLIREDRDEGGERNDVDEERAKKERRDRRKGVVSVSVPGPWGVFVIKSEDGRVIVVDSEGDFEGGGSDNAEGIESWRGRDEWRRRNARRREDEATDEQMGMHLSRHDERTSRPAWTPTCSQSSESHSPPRTSRRRSKKKTRSLDTRSEHGFGKSVQITPPTSPTEHMMTGGASGWPSRKPSLRLSTKSHIIPHAITWGNTRSSLPLPQSYSSKKSETRHSCHSISGSWSSSTVSGIRSASSSSSDSDPTPFGSPSRRSPSGTPRRSRHTSYGTQQALSYSPPPAFSDVKPNYHAPSIAEVIYDETPPGEISHSYGSHSATQLSQQSQRITTPPPFLTTVSGKSEHNLSQSEGVTTPPPFLSTISEKSTWDEKSAWDDRPHALVVKSPTHDSSPGWSSSSTSTSDTPASLRGDHHKPPGPRSRGHSSVLDWDNAKSTTHAASGLEDQVEEAGKWDGFERRKTLSELSVADGDIRSDYELSWPPSVDEAMRAATMNTGVLIAMQVVTPVEALTATAHTMPPIKSPPPPWSTASPPSADAWSASNTDSWADHTSNEGKDEGQWA